MVNTVINLNNFKPKIIKYFIFFIIAMMCFSHINAAASVTFPTDATITYGQTLSQAVLTGADNDGIDGTFSFADENLIPAVSDSGTEYHMQFIPDDTENYETVSKAVPVTVNKKVLAWNSPVPAAKVYDGTVAVTSWTVSPALRGFTDADDAGATYSGVFSSKSVGARSATVTAAPTGESSVNYTYPNPCTAATVSRTITPKIITSENISGAELVPKIYNGTTSASILSRGVIASAESTADTRLADGKLVYGDTVTLAGGNARYSSTAYGTKTGSVTNMYLTGAQAVNYFWNTSNVVSASGSVSKKVLSWNTPIPKPKVYDGTVKVTGWEIIPSIVGFTNNDGVGASYSSSFSSKNCGARTVTVTASPTGSSTSNYTFPGAYTTAPIENAITPRELTWNNLKASDKKYDGNANILNWTISPILSNLTGNDGISIKGYTGTFDNEAIGDDKPVTVAANFNTALTSNYSYANHTDSTASITTGPAPNLTSVIKFSAADNEGTALAPPLFTSPADVTTYRNIPCVIITSTFGGVNGYHLSGYKINGGVTTAISVKDNIIFTPSAKIVELTIIYTRETTYSISGNVTFDGGNGTANIALKQNGAVKYNAVTSEKTPNGNIELPFEITEVQPGAYTLTVTRDGHLPATVVNLVVTDRNFTVPVPLKLYAGKVTASGSAIGSEDYVTFLSAYNTENGLCDFSGNGTADSEDYVIFLSNYGRQAQTIDMEIY